MNTVTMATMGLAVVLACAPARPAWSAEPPQFSAPRNLAAGPFWLALSTPEPGAHMRYATDGSAPTPSNGVVYSTPIFVTNSMNVRAIAVVSGAPPSEVATHTYLFPDQTVRQTRGSYPASWGYLAVADYEMDPKVVTNSLYAGTVTNDLLAIPSLILACAPGDLFGTHGIYYSTNTLQRGDAWERAVSVELLDAARTENAQVNCGVQISGGASRNPQQTSKHSLRLVFKSRFGPSVWSYRFFPDTRLAAFDDIVLRAGFNDSWTARARNLHLPGQYVRDRFIRGLQRAMGVDCGSSRFVHLYLNALYWGVYDATSMPDAQYAAHRFGGSESDYDSIYPVSDSAEQVDIESGTWDAFTSMFALVNAGVTSAAQYAALQAYLDVPRFADYMILNHWAMNADWPRGNWRLLRERPRAGRFVYHCWDAEWTVATNQPNWFPQRGDLRYVINGLGSDNDPTFAWCPGRLFWRLFGCAEFRLLYADRVQRWCGRPHALLQADAVARYATLAGELDRAIVAESARWGDAVSWRTTTPYTRDAEWIAQRDWVLHYLLTNRTAAYLEICRGTGLYPRLAAPVFAPHHGGLITPGWELSITNPATAGAVYYTCDGSDPREAFSGAVAAGALLATGAPVVLAQSALVKARVWHTGVWSALAEALFWCTNDNAALRVTELMYQPRGGAEYEFIEVKNTGSTTLPIAGLHFSEGIHAAVPEGVLLPPGELYVMITHRRLFDQRYPAAPAGERYLGQLDNAGEKITLCDAFSNVIESFTYVPAWQPLTQGQGCSLVRRTPYGNPGLSSSWRASTFENGSPGADDPEPGAATVVINEVLAHAVPPLEQAIELHNLSSTSVAIGGWYVSDRADDLQRYRIADGTLLAPTGFVALYAYQLQGGTDESARVRLSPQGGVVHLSSPESPPLFHAAQAYSASACGASHGRYRRSDGAAVFVALSNLTFGSAVGPDDPPALSNAFRAGMGAPNAPPKTGPIVVSEFMYHPAPGGFEFVELANISTSDYLLSHTADQQATWYVNDDTATMYVIPTGVVVRAGEWVVLTGEGVNPSAFRAHYGIPDTVPVLGPCTRSLGNGGDALRVFEPVTLAGGTDMFSVLVEEIVYADRAPWPAAADGGGPSLERVRLDAFANDAQNWQAGPPGGTPGGIPEPGAVLVLVCLLAQREYCRRRAALRRR